MLVVEDEPDIAALIAYQLTREGFRVETSASGPEALEAGYAWLYERLFSHRSIWARRPHDRHALLPGRIAAALRTRLIGLRPRNCWRRSSGADTTRA